MHTLICVTFSLPPDVGGWLRLLLVALPGLFCLPFCYFCYSRPTSFGQVSVLVIFVLKCFLLKDWFIFYIFLEMSVLDQLAKPTFRFRYAHTSVSTSSYSFKLESDCKFCNEVTSSCDHHVTLVRFSDWPSDLTSYFTCTYCHTTHQWKKLKVNITFNVWI